jgi:hypothetical protein
MMDRFNVSPLISENIVSANEQRRAALSMLLPARHHHWMQGVLGLRSNHVDLACGTGFATTPQSYPGSAQNVGGCADIAALAGFSA